VHQQRPDDSPDFRTGSFGAGFILPIRLAPCKESHPRIYTNQDHFVTDTPVKFQFIHRIQGLHLTGGNKTAGFLLALDTEALRQLRQLPVTLEENQTLLIRMRERVLRAKLMKKSLLRALVSAAHVHHVQHVRCKYRRFS
jgi:hypothetical protein